MSLKIFIVEDHLVMRYTLSKFIQKELGLEVCGEAATGVEALERLAEVEADVALIDVLLAGMSGLQLVEQLQERYPGLLCLMLSGHGETFYIREAFRLGARGYILKGNPPELGEAIQTVCKRPPNFFPVKSLLRTGSRDFSASLRNDRLSRTCNSKSLLRIGSGDFSTPFRNLS